MDNTNTNTQTPPQSEPVNQPGTSTDAMTLLGKSTPAGGFKSANRTTPSSYPAFTQKLADYNSTRSEPVATASIDNLGPITTRFGESTKFEKSHKGLDIGFTGPTNIPILNSGVVESVHGGQRPQDMSGYGNYVIIRDANGNKWKYSHLDSFNVKPGDQVNAGEMGKLVGGNTGSVYSLHGGGGYHLDLRISDMYNNFMDPALFLKGMNKTQNA